MENRERTQRSSRDIRPRCEDRQLRAMRRARALRHDPNRTQIPDRNKLEFE